MFISIILNLANKFQSQSNLLLRDRKSSLLRRERIVVSAKIELQPQDNYNLNWWFQSRLAASKHK